MADNQTDSPGGGVENLEVSLPEVTSDPSSGERSSAVEPQKLDQSSLVQLAEAVVELATPKLRETLKPDIEVGIQSTKDRRFKKLEALDPEDVSLVAAVLKQAGDDPIRASQELGLRALLEERRSSDSAPEPTPATQAASVSTSDGDASKAERENQVRTILSNSGLEEDEAKVVMSNWAKKEFTSVDESLAELTRMAIAQVRQPESLAVGDTVPSSSTTAIESADNEQVLVELYAELDELNKAPTQNADRRAEVITLLEKHGEEIPVVQ